MRKSTIVFILSVFLLVAHLITVVVASYRYTLHYGYHWELADKSSTIAAKAVHVNNFISSIESNRSAFADSGALFLHTPNNSLDANLAALKTLGTRLDEVANMDPKSFEYQTAIQQITQQEQGEAGDMLSILSNCWLKRTHFVAWGFIPLFIALWAGSAMVSGFLVFGFDLL